VTKESAIRPRSEIAEAMLPDLDKFALEAYLNELAPNFSKSVLTKIRVYFSSILEQALELEAIGKNQAAKLAVPRSGKKVTGIHLTPEQIPVVLFNLSDRDRLIVRIFLVLGLRPDQLFALRWNDKMQNSLRIDTSITDGIEVERKTEGSNANLRLPVSIERLSLNGGGRSAGTPAPRCSSSHQRGGAPSTPTISFSASSKKRVGRPASTV
jgi:integrase